MKRANRNFDEPADGQAERDEADPPGALTTRRAVIAGVAVGLAGLVVDSVISAQPASATNPPVLLGTANSATATTEVTTTSGEGLKGVTLDASGSGVFAQGGSYGVYGEGGNYGVFGTDASLSAIAIGASITNPSNGSTALQAETAGTGSAVEATIDNTANSSPAFVATTNGTGSAVEATITNAANSSPAVSAATNGTDSAVFAETSGSGPGVEAYSQSGVAIYGQSATGTGVEGTSGTGPGLYGNLVNAANTSPAVQATTAGTGNALAASITNAANTQPAVFGTTNGSGPGVFGESTKAGGTGTTGQGSNGATGLYGLSDSGTGVFAKSISGDALKVVGKVAFSRSGLVTLAAKKKSVKVTLAGVTTSSMILATLQSDAGDVAVANAVAAPGFFTIKLTAAHSSSVKVAWFVIG